MSRRIEIELTSARPDGSWHWRAAGAREPRGVLEGQLLYEGAKCGDVVRADADFEMDGIVITGIFPPREKKRSEPERIELIRPSGEDAPGVTTQLVGRAGRGDRGGDRGHDRRRGERDSSRPGREGPRPDRSPGDGSTRDGSRRDASTRGGSTRDGSARGGSTRDSSTRGGSTRDGGRTHDGAAGGTGPAGPRDGGVPGAPEPGRPGGSDSGRVAPERGRGRPGAPTRRPDGSPAAGGARSGSGPRRDGPGRAEGDRARSGRPEAGRSEGESGGAGRTRRLSAGHAHRQEVMSTLAPEEQAVAEQVLRGGIPAVRTAMQLEGEKATAEGRPAPHAEQLLALAESLLPRLKAAEWRDRAEAAVKAGDDIALRDLRSVVAGADIARDEGSRDLAVALRTSLDRRVEALRGDWARDVTRHLDEGRVVRALQLAGRPPDAGTRLSSELAERTSAAASVAMAPDTPSDLWMALLDAAAASPVRRSVVPAGLPAQPGTDLLRAAHQQSGRIPALATMLGITIPPPPGPRAGSSPRRPPTPPARPTPARSEVSEAVDEPEVVPPPDVDAVTEVDAVVEDGGGSNPAQTRVHPPTGVNGEDGSAPGRLPSGGAPTEGEATIADEAPVGI